jgi:hypothetical protein
MTRRLTLFDMNPKPKIAKKRSTIFPSSARGLGLLLALLNYSIQLNSANASVTHQSYTLKGDLTYSYFDQTNDSGRIRCVIQRDGDILRLQTSPISSNYPSFFYVSDSNIAYTASQYVGSTNELTQTGQKKTWNTGNAYVDIYRLPKYGLGNLNGLWLMAQGNREYTRRRDTPWVTVFGNIQNPGFSVQPRTTPEVQANPLWPDGFAKYSEVFSTPGSNPGQSNTVSGEFVIHNWTNCSGVIFPRDFTLICKRSSQSNEFVEKCEFVVSSIEEVGKMPPVLSCLKMMRVIDMRSESLKQTPVGIVYAAKDGIIYTNPLQERQERGIKLGVASNRLSTQPPVERRSRFLILSTMAILAMLPAFFWVMTRRKNKTHPTKQ